MYYLRLGFDSRYNGREKTGKGKGKGKEELKVRLKMKNFFGGGRVVRRRGL